MDRKENVRILKQMVWGVILIGIGGLFLADRLGFTELPEIWDLWPLVLFVIGGLHVAEGRPGSGVQLILLGSWFLAVTNSWLGLTWSNSWPLALVAAGAGIVVRAISGEDRRSRRSKKEKEASHVDSDR